MKPRQEHIVETAVQLFNQRGYFQTSVADIDKAANVSKGVFYHYFPNGKKELMKQVLSTSLDRVQAHETKIFAENDPVTACHQLLADLTDELQNRDDHSVPVGAFTNDAVRADPDDQAIIGLSQAIFEVTQNALRACLLRHGYTSELADQRSQLFNLAIKGALSLGVIPTTIAYFQTLDASLDIFFARS